MPPARPNVADETVRERARTGEGSRLVSTPELEELRAADGAIDAERVQLWPGHLDPATAIGDTDAGSRATYGFSPGDHSHDEPYIYVTAHGDVDRSNEYWNEGNFSGASLTCSDLLAAPDQYERAQHFLRTGYALLNG